jgi:hypothetical protein
MVEFLKRFCLVALICLLPSALTADHGRGHGGCYQYRGRDCQTVPEGGSTGLYLLGAGATCLAAIAIRSRAAKLGA